ncbi:hypothetical protein SMSP2_01585 [Limihaloglobus sulfuriphilus]|uniref:Cell division protein FtsQ n=1 Tax=Limihaloglobus sulfuriphilus TaxID=1851148 RepID=A0A1Q2MEY6_9BACT|nr:hypothetical protein [Limihaloglobus sulfuriphilus]AQQ71219.1 hypothetical protein SMSP2_01585 [Limihaloglobus sulfuriphilus]
MAKSSKSKKADNNAGKTGFNIKHAARRLGLVFTVIFFLALIVGLPYSISLMNKYVHRNIITALNEQASIFLVEDKYDVKFSKPDWVTAQLEERIINAAIETVGSATIESGAAVEIGEKLALEMDWLSDVKVVTVRDGIDIYISYREPVALFKYDNTPYYLDSSCHVLNYCPVKDLNIVEITGFSTSGQTVPMPGVRWRRPELEAAVTLINLCRNMDRELAGKPLLSEIARIDTSKFNSSSVKDSKLTMVVDDGTKIFWGEPVQKASIKAEATDSEKLMRLYGFFGRYGTLRGTAQSLDLRRPAGMVPFSSDN